MVTGSGDPFYSKIYRDYLLNFDITKYPKLEQLQIITNGNLLDEPLWKKMKATPYIKTIEISIDAATKETYEKKTRWNGQWDRLIENLKLL
jgi:MoaA/NifB/PqqE/SkfB family radical SAM enzyme